ASLNDLASEAINAHDTALIFEGGGMRNSYTAACVKKLIDNGVEFGWVVGVSAGASHAVNFLSLDSFRAVESVVEFAKNPSFGGLSSMLRGTGYFNAEFIYERPRIKICLLILKPSPATPRHLISLPLML